MDAEKQCIVTIPPPPPPDNNYQIRKNSKNEIVTYTYYSYTQAHLPIQEIA